MKDKPNKDKESGCCDGCAGDVLRTHKTDWRESDAKAQNFDSAPSKSAAEQQPSTTGKGPA